MKTFKEYLTELFDRPAPYRIKSKSDTLWIAEFKTDAGTYRWYAEDTGRGRFNNAPWEITFTLNNNSKIKTSQDAEGEEIKAFSTILALTEEFAKEKKPQGITIHASKFDNRSGSRASLYEKLIKKYASKFGYKLFGKKEDSSDVFFRLERK